MYRKILLLLSLIISCHIGLSQVIIQEDTVECSIYFHQGKSDFDPAYKNNGKRLKEFVNDVYFRSDDPNKLEDTHAIFFAPAVEDWDTTDAKEEFDGKTFDHMLFEGSMPLGAELIPVGGNHRMLPHDLDLSVELTYDLYSEDGTYKYPDKQIKTNTLKVTWIPGHSYTYSIVLSANEATIGYAYP